MNLLGKCGIKNCSFRGTSSSFCLNQQNSGSFPSLVPPTQLFWGGDITGGEPLSPWGLGRYQTLRPTDRGPEGCRFLLGSPGSPGCWHLGCHLGTAAKASFYFSGVLSGNARCFCLSRALTWPGRVSHEEETKRICSARRSLRGSPTGKPSLLSSAGPSGKETVGKKSLMWPEFVKTIIKLFPYTVSKPPPVPSHLLFIL